MYDEEWNALEKKDQSSALGYKMLVDTLKPSPLPNKALRRCRVFETCDVEQSRHQISEIMQPHKLIPLGGNGRPLMYMDYLPLRDMGIGAIGLGHTQVDVGTVGDYHLIIFCTAGSALIARGNGEEQIDVTTGTCLAPGERFAGRFSADCEQLVLRINANMFDAHTGVKNSRLRSQFKVNSVALRPWFSVLRSIVEDPVTTDLIRHDPRIANDYEQLLTSLLISGQKLEPDIRRSGAIPSCVRKAEAFMQETFSSPLRLEDIANAAEVSPRALLDAFARFRGISPMRRLREIRLEHTRSVLLLPNNRMTVAVAALDAGFAHLGRFSSDYQARFGELPSKTLERSCRNKRT